MTLEEYKDAYFRRWQKRLNLQCWIIFFSVIAITAIITTVMNVFIERNLSRLIKQVLVRILIPVILDLAALLIGRHIIKSKKYSSYICNRCVIWQFFLILSVVSVFQAYYSVVLILPSLTMLISSSIADKKLLRGLLISSLAVFFSSSFIYLFAYKDISLSYKITTFAIDIAFILLAYKISKELLRSSVSQINFITHNYKKQVALSEELKLDTLTQLLNRRALADTVSKLIKINQTTDEQMGITFLDLDNFKGVNDTFGHATGDAVLMSLASAIIEVMGTNRNAFRFGGDEFVITFRNKNLAEIISVIEQIMQKFNENSFDYLPEGTRCTISAGISLYKSGWNSKEWFKSADDAAYKAKQKGKNRYEIAD